jgi:hypothetical protein
MELEGTVKVIFDEQKFDSGFYKREFVVTTAEQYPQDVKFELLKDKTELIRDTKVGDRLKVFFDIRGREWNGNYYNNLVAWKIEQAGATPPPVSSGESPFDADLSDINSDDDDLPF